MNTYRITNPDTGEVISITGDSAPSELEINQIFAETNGKNDINLEHVVSDAISDSPRISTVDERIQERGTAYMKDRVDEWLQSDGLVSPALKGLRVASAPQERTEAAIANAMMAVQDGRFDEIVDEFKAGASGKKLGEIGDVFRRSKVPVVDSEPFASTAGFLISMVSPLTLIGRADKAMRGLITATDKKIISASNDLIRGSNEAVEVIGRNVDKAYARVNDVQADGMKFLNALNDAPELLVKSVEKEIGESILDIASAPTIENIRKVKKAIGELNPTAFGKVAKGLHETVEAKNINKTYGNIKNLIRDTLTEKGLSKESEYLDKADEAFRETINASRYIKKVVTDKTTLKATKGGAAAKGLINQGDTTFRVALEDVKKAGGLAKKNINKAVDALEKYNRHLATQSILRTTAKAAIFGGAVGAIGGRAAGTVIKRD